MRQTNIKRNKQTTCQTVISLGRKKKKEVYDVIAIEDEVIFFREDLSKKRKHEISGKRTLQRKESKHRGTEVEHICIQEWQSQCD